MSNQLREAITIRKCDNLNKENFWNIAMEIYPNATKAFCNWVDNYKKIKFIIPELNENLSINTWDELFFNNGETPLKIKFHHLPIEMQVGIIFRFFEEQGCQSSSANIYSIEENINHICNTLENLQETF